MKLFKRPEHCPQDVSFINPRTVKRSIFAAIGMALLMGNALHAEDVALSRKATAPLRYSKIMGTVRTLNAGKTQITVRDAKGSDFVFQMGTATKSLRESKNELNVLPKPGDRVSVRYDLATQTALRIDILEPLQPDPLRE